MSIYINRFFIEINLLILYYFSSVCFCSVVYIPRQMKQYDVECSINCSGDNTASCGGVPNYVSSYLTDNSSKAL